MWKSELFVSVHTVTYIDTNYITIGRYNRFHYHMSLFKKLALSGDTVWK